MPYIKKISQDTYFLPLLSRGREISHKGLGESLFSPKVLFKGNYQYPTTIYKIFSLCGKYYGFITY